MPLTGYMKTTDPGRISSITNIAGDKGRRKKIIPLAGSGQELYVSTYVLDCISHDPPGAVVPVILHEFKHGVGWVSIGTAQCCPLCWRIIKPPVGVDLPKPERQKLSQKPTTKQSKVLREGRTRKRESTKQPQGYVDAQRVLKFGTGGRIFDSYEIMDLLGKNRPAVVEMLGRMTRLGQIEVVHQGAGRGDRTTHRIKA